MSDPPDPATRVEDGVLPALPDRSGAGGGLDILLIEDNPVDAAMVRALLADELSVVHRCALARTLAEGRTALAGSSPSCVLLDLGLPDSDGLATLNEIIALAPDTPIVVFTGLDDDDTGREAVTHGAQDYLVKGNAEAHPETLTRSVLYAIERHRQQAALRAAHAALIEAKARFQRVFDSAPAGMALVALDGRLLEVNPALIDMTGRPEPHLLSVNIRDTVPADNRVGFDAAFDRLSTGELTNLSVETPLVGLNDRQVWAFVTAAAVNDAQGHPAYVILQAQDITARKDAEAQLVHQTLHDPLTGLSNRVLLHDRLELALARLDRRREPVGIFYLDLDRLKLINDTLGHGCGDELIVEIGRRLLAAVRASDTVARLGGDEFVVLADGLSGWGEASRLADRFRAAVAAPIRLAGTDVVPSVSIGIALTTDQRCAPSQLLREADAAMYREKRRGRSCRNRDPVLVHPSC